MLNGDAKQKMRYSGNLTTSRATIDNNLVRVCREKEREREWEGGGGDTRNIFFQVSKLRAISRWITVNNFHCWLISWSLA